MAWGAGSWTHGWTSLVVVDEMVLLLVAALAASVATVSPSTGAARPLRRRHHEPARHRRLRPDATQLRGRGPRGAPGVGPNNRDRVTLSRSAGRARACAPCSTRRVARAAPRGRGVGASGAPSPTQRHVRLPARGPLPSAARLPHARGRRGALHVPRALTNGAPHAPGRVARRMRMASSHTTPTRPARLLAVLLVAPFMAQADATIANVAAPSIHADLHTTGAELELVIGAYLIAFAVLLITGARLGQLHGYRRMFLLGVGVFTGASLLCGLAPGPIALIAARALQGAGAALMFPQALDRHPADLRGRRACAGDRPVRGGAVDRRRGRPGPRRRAGVGRRSGQRLALDLLRQRPGGRGRHRGRRPPPPARERRGARGTARRRRGRRHAVGRGAARGRAARPRARRGLAGVDLAEPRRECAGLRRLRRRDRCGCAAPRLS